MATVYSFPEVLVLEMLVAVVGAMVCGGVVLGVLVADLGPV